MKETKKAQRFLVVERDATEASLLEELLLQAFPQACLRVCHSFAEALRNDYDDVDLVLLDPLLEDLPGVSPFSLFPAAPVVVCVHPNDEAAGFSAVEQGAEDFVLKGFCPPSLLRRVVQNAMVRHQRISGLKSAEQDLQRVIETLPDGVIIHRDGRILHANRAMTLLLANTDANAPSEDGETFEQEPQLVGASFESLFAEHHRALLNADDEDFPIELLLKAGDGTREVEISSALQIQIAQAPATLQVIRDMSVRRALEAKLWMAGKLAGLATLSMGVAHEVNNPLTFITQNICHLEGLLDAPLRLQGGLSVDDANEAIEVLEEMREGANRIKRIVDELGRYSRSDDPAAAVNLAQVVQWGKTMIYPYLTGGATLDVEVNDELQVWASETRLAQIVLHLLRHAADALKGGMQKEAKPTVQVRADVRGHSIHLLVSDNGECIDPSVLPRVFDPLFMARDGNETSLLGLSLAQRLVLGCGGEMSVDSVEGEGTVVDIRLPHVPHVMDTSRSAASNDIQNEDSVRTCRTENTTETERIAFL
ncbi:MAG: PAS domain-containing protein [Deltaproteobacteria bacterium]|nr:PAS domain-containing protein [Deltaproteobacteria bacterium]